MAPGPVTAPLLLGLAAAISLIAVALGVVFAVRARRWIEEGRQLFTLFQERVLPLDELLGRLAAMDQALRVLLRRIDEPRAENLHPGQAGEALSLEQDQVRSVLAHIGVPDEIFDWVSRSAGTERVAQVDPEARVLYIVARDQPELLAFLRRDFAAEESEGVIEILMNRRQVVQPREADRRDPRRNQNVSIDLREVGFVFVRQQVPLPQGPVSNLVPLFPAAHGNSGPRLGASGAPGRSSRRKEGPGLER